MQSILPRRHDGGGRTMPFQSVDAVFHAQAEHTPDAPALVYRGDTVSYAVLDQAVERLARRLFALGIGPEQVVALGLPRSPGMIVAMLAVLRVGGAYLPLELTHPAARNAFLVRDGRALLLVTAAGEDGLPDDPENPLPRLELDPADGSTADRRVLPGGTWPALHPDNLASLLYTSGSTGAPKAVAVTQHNIVSFALRPEFVPIGPGSRVLHMGSPAFDVTTFEVLAPLLSGACVVVVRQGVPGLDEMASVIIEQRVDTMWLTAGLFRHIAEDRPDVFRSVRWLVAGGEAVSPASVRRVMAVAPDTHMICGYGPTETTTFSSSHPVRPEDLHASTVPIGTALRDERMFILDDHLQPVPQGETGMLYIAGDGVTRGYAGQPGLTAERYLPCPFGPPGSRMYMSGDLARWLPNGAAEFQGRADQLVKLRGLRVEPGEIEQALLASDDVAQAVVAARDIAGDTKLIAWIATRPGFTLPSDDVLRTRLAATLPDFMIPAAFVPIERLPLTASGKLDRRALPMPTLREAAYEPPVGDVEAAIAAQFAALTGMATVGRHADFFRIGGNSLLAMRLLARLRAESGAALPLAAVFRNPTPAGLAPLLHTLPAAGWSPLVPLRRHGSARPLFCVHPATGSAAGFKPLADALGDGYPVWGLQARGLEGNEDPQTSIPEMAESYVAAIRSVQPDPPYVLAGWSLGGIVAQAMACRLESEGARVAVVVCLDSMVPAATALEAAGDQRFNEDFLLRAAARGPVDRARVAELLHAAAVARGVIPAETPSDWGELLLRQVNLTKVRLDGYAPTPCRAPIVMFRAGSNISAESDADFDWSWLTAGGVTRHVLDCGHNTILAPREVAQIADRLRPFLR